jgi:hypothetical protein
MSSQIFKQNISNSLLFQLLDDIAVKNVKDCFYFVDNNVYKRGVFTKKIEEFYKICRPFYHISKRKYLDKKLTYNSFITVIRQICNSNKLTYTSQIKYNKSIYDIVYSISYKGINILNDAEIDVKNDESCSDINNNAGFESETESD